MKCLAKNNKGNRCGNNAKVSGLGFCKSDHKFYTSSWYFLGKLQWLRYPFYVLTMSVTFALSSIIAFEIEEWWGRNKEEILSLIDTNVKKPFDKSSSEKPNNENFKILILPFEDRVEKKDAGCIGYSIFSYLDDIRINEKYPIDLLYLDTIKPPRDLELAVKYQLEHESDLVIFGLAKNLEKKCQGAEVCFRYNLNVVENEPKCSLPTMSYDLDFIYTQQENLEQGQLTEELNSLVNWFAALSLFKTQNYQECIQIIQNQRNLTSPLKDEFLEIEFNCFAEMNNYQKAVRNFDERVSLNPNNENAYVDLSKYLFFKTGYTMYTDTAITYLTQGLKLNPNSIEMRYQRARAFQIVTKYDQSLKDLNIILDRYPNNCEALRVRGWVYQSMGKCELAIMDFNKSSANLDIFIFECYLSLKDFNSADSLSNAILETSKNSTGIFMRAQYLFAIEKYSEAKEFIDKIDYNKNSPMVNELRDSINEKLNNKK